MRGEGITKEVLEYLKKEGSTNTFKMARTLGRERNMLLNVIGKLEKKEAVKCEQGKVTFLKFPPAEKLVSVKKPVKVRVDKVSPVTAGSPVTERQKAETAASRRPASSKALQLLRTENKQLQQKVLQLEETMKELEQKASAVPRTITKTVTKTIIKKVPVTKTVVRKIQVPAPLPRISVPAPLAESKFWEKLVTHSEQFTEQFKDSGFKLLDNVKQLREPEFVRL